MLSLLHVCQSILQHGGDDPAHSWHNVGSVPLLILSALSTMLGVRMHLCTTFILTIRRGASALCLLYLRRLQLSNTSNSRISIHPTPCYVYIHRRSIHQQLQHLCVTNAPSDILNISSDDTSTRISSAEASGRSLDHFCSLQT